MYTLYSEMSSILKRLVRVLDWLLNCSFDDQPERLFKNKRSGDVISYIVVDAAFKFLKLPQSFYLSVEGD